MLYRKRIDNKVALTNQIFKIFTDSVGGDVNEFSDIVYSKYEVECFEFSDDFKYWQVYEYFKNKLIPHKIAVYQAGLELSRYEWFKKLNIDKERYFDNLWLHDISKFSAIESVPYAFHDFSKPEMPLQMKLAWNHHTSINPHHPEYWFNPTKGGKLDVLPMSDIYIIEMIADWIGAGRTYAVEFKDWLPDNLHKFLWHRETANKVKQILENLGFVVLQSQNQLCIGK